MAVTRVSGTEHTFIQPGGLVKFEATFAEDTGENDQPAPSGVPQLVCTVTFYCYSGDCFSCAVRCTLSGQARVDNGNALWYSKVTDWFL